MTGAQVIQMLSQNYRLPQPSNCPQQFYSIMLECWNAEPKQRPTFETLHWKLEDYFETDTSYSDTNNFIKWTPKRRNTTKTWRKSESSVHKYNVINQLWNQFLLTYSGGRVNSAMCYILKKIICVFYWLGSTAGQSKMYVIFSLPGTIKHAKWSYFFFLLRTTHISIYCWKCRSRESTDDSFYSVTVVAFSCLLIRMVIHYSSNRWIPSGCYYEGIWLLCSTAGPVLGDFFPSLLKYPVTTMMAKPC